ncbi:hypothetical protein Noda2021_04630 [Candidatus Dependentiae bacterium Noda2021]|nr:hypothetical protein Noda2021_04630 [Candidatus Dependentiae bacterium Noda2021]
MNINYVVFSSFLFLPIHASDKTITPLRTMALEAATHVLHAKLQEPQSYEDRIALINQWQEKSGLVTLKDDCKQETILDRFEQKYFTQLHEFKTLKYPIGAMTSDGTQLIAVDDNFNLIVFNTYNDHSLTLKGHTDHISHVAIISNNTKAISSSADSHLRLWDLTTGHCLAILEGHSDIVSHVAITSDNLKAISASYDTTLKVWDLNTYQPIATLQGHSDEVNHVVITSDNSKAISVSDDGTLRLWDLNTYKLIAILSEQKANLYHVVITPDNSKTISASDDSLLNVWDLNTYQHLATFDKHCADVSHIAITSDNLKAISSSFDKTLRLWDLNNAQPLATFEGHTAFTHVAITPDNTKAISVSSDKTFKLWNLSTGTLLQTSFLGSQHNRNKIHIQKNFVAAENKLFKLEDWQSIIKRMPTE